MVPEYDTEWYARNMYVKDSKVNLYHKEHYGDPSELGYKDFLPMFKAEKFDADEWARLFKEAGATFAGPVAIHHDGFSMWDSEINRWNAQDIGPQRDVSRELEKAIRKQGLHYIATFHHAWTRWYFPRNEEYDTSDPEYADLYGNLEIEPYEERCWAAKKRLTGQ